MPFKITKQKDGGAITEFEGLITPEQNAEVYKKIFGENLDQIKTILYVISDYTKATKVTHSAEEVRELSLKAKKGLEANPEMVMVLVVPKDLFFGLARMWHAHLEEEDRAGLFRTREEAETWIKEKLSEKPSDP